MNKTNNYDIELLSLGPQFIPTPKWEIKIIQKEKENLIKHIRAIEWKDVLINKDKSVNDTNQIYCNLNNKLKIPNFSVKSQITRNAESYIENVRNKFRNLKHKVMHMDKFKNNLNKNLQKALRNLRNKTKNREIVIGNSDKDGKIVITNYQDYIS